MVTQPRTLNIMYETTCMVCVNGAVVLVCVSETSSLWTPKYLSLSSRSMHTCARSENSVPTQKQTMRVRNAKSWAGGGMSDRREGVSVHSVGMWTMSK